MKFICPLITVSNIAQSRKFYEEVLGQKVKYDFGENVTFHGDFAIHLDSHFGKLINNKTIQKGSNSFELYFEENNLEQLNEKLIDYGVEFIHPLKEQPWKQKVVRFYDPDMNIIEVGESLKHTAKRLNSIGNSTQQIAELMDVPISEINQWLKD
jgi:catechol 2,3-dioxygenase-like lactoylglutathione lyase family enzyme